MFPEINKIFRKKNSLKILTLKILQNSTELLKEANINPTNSPNEEGKYIIEDNRQKLNLIAVHFAKINRKNDNIGKPQLNAIVEREAGAIKSAAADDLEREITISNFNNENPADCPIENENLPNYFTSFEVVEKKFKSLNNKKSTGNDHIPNIELKHMHRIIIWQYTILFNNMLNLGYFPKNWKKLK